MARELRSMDISLLEVYADAVLDRFQKGEWDIIEARQHLVRAFELFDPESEAFFNHTMAAIKS